MNKIIEIKMNIEDTIVKSVEYFVNEIKKEETVQKYFDQLLNRLSEIRKCWIKSRDSRKVTYVLEEMDDIQSKLWNIVQFI